MVTEFIKGTTITSTAEICTMLMHPHDVAEKFMYVFSDMLFRTGFVHCDPHPGNAMVRTPSNMTITKESQVHLYECDGKVPIEVFKGIVRHSAIDTNAGNPTMLTKAVDTLLGLTLLPIILPLKALLYVNANLQAVVLDYLNIHDPILTTRNFSKYADAYIHTQIMPKDTKTNTTTVITRVFPQDHPEIRFSRAEPFSQKGVEFLNASVEYFVSCLRSPALSQLLLTPPTFTKPHSMYDVKPILNAPQVVLLDHGLYREFDPVFRYNFARLFHAFLRQDDAAIEQISEDLEMGEFAMLLSLIFSHRIPYSKNKSLSNTKLTEQDQQRLRKSFERMDLQDILSALPVDLAFAMKTISLLRSVGSQLLYPRNERMKVFFMSAITGLYYKPMLAAQNDVNPLARVYVSAPYARVGEEQYKHNTHDTILGTEDPDARPTKLSIFKKWCYLALSVFYDTLHEPIVPCQDTY